jgi:3-hydroxybutyryl-CoA dehydratase
MEINSISLQGFQPGSPLPVLERVLTQEKICQYAEAVSDFNPIHVDAGFAAGTSFGGTIAHGMLILAYVSEVMEMAFGEHWAASGRLSVRFKAPARSTDTVTVTGRVETVSVNGGNHIYKCIVDCHNQDGATIIIGDTEVSVPYKQ